MADIAGTTPQVNIAPAVDVPPQAAGAEDDAAAARASAVADRQLQFAAPAATSTTPGAVHAHILHLCATTTADETEAQMKKSMPVRQYLESTVVPILLEGLQKLVLERPSDPIDFLVGYLSQNNPRRIKSVPPSSEVPVPPMNDDPSTASLNPAPDQDRTSSTSIPPNIDGISITSINDRTSINSTSAPINDRTSTSSTANSAPKDRASIITGAAAELPNLEHPSSKVPADINTNEAASVLPAQ